MPEVDHSDVGFVPAGADHSDVGFVPTDPHGMLAKGAHYAAKALPLVGGFLGAIPGAAAGAAVGAPAGPAAIATGAIGAGIGAGMGAAAGRGAQHVLDTALGYEKPIENAEDLKNKTADMALEGLASGAGTAAGTAVVGAAAPLLGKIAPALKNAALAQGRRVLTGGANTLAAKVPLADEAVDEAFKLGAIKPFGTTKGASEVLSSARENIGDIYGRILKALESRGITGPNAQALAQQYAAEGSAAGADTMVDAVPAAYERAAAQIASKPTDAMGNLGLQRAEKLKRSMQGLAKSAYQKLEPDEVGDAHEAAAAILRKANEDAVTAGAAASGDPTTQAIASAFEPVKNQLANIIPADNAAFKGAAQAAGRRAISPSDYIAGAAGVASGNPVGGGGMMVANHLLRTRGTSTAAWGLNQAASTAQKLQAIVTSNPAALGRYGTILSKALQEGDQSFAANSYALSQTDPEFQELNRKLAESK